VSRNKDLVVGGVLLGAKALKGIGNAVVDVAIASASVTAGAVGVLAETGKGAYQKRMELRTRKEKAQLQARVKNIQSFLGSEQVREVPNVEFDSSFIDEMNKK